MVKSGPTQRLSRWLKKFEKALSASDADAVVALFGKDCYWRDLVAFTWNIRTLEGRPVIAEMLRARLADVAPSHWAIKGEATEEGEITEGWLTFETKVGQLRKMAGHMSPSIQQGAARMFLDPN